MAVRLSDFHAELSDADILDPFRGRDDLQKHVIRAVSGTIFYEDAVRLLRGVRMAGELGFTIEPETEELIKDYVHLVSNVPGERIREEILRLLALPEAGKMLKYLDELGLLTAIFTELEESSGLKQPKEHYWDVLEHSLATVDALEFILGDGEWEYAKESILETVPLSDKVIEHLNEEISSGSTRKSLLKLSALLHDTGKPMTKAVDDAGRMRFLGHAKEGARLVRERMQHLRFSSREIKLVETAITHHMRPTQLSQEGLPTNRAVYRYYRDTGPTGIDILFLNLADHLATRGPKLNTANWKEHTELVTYLIDKYFEKETVINPPKIVDGYDIIKFFGLSPGPRVGEILDAVREAQASGEITGREEAMSFVRKLVDSRDSLNGDNSIN
jgi:poly(A) polymerase